ncbi:hypothetical protein GC177_00680 [bacterium]|nr:hypothetical protein [bacterium]
MVKRRSPSKGFALKLIGVSFFLVVVIQHSFIFLIAGMLPAIVASIVDRSQSRYQLKTVAAMNFAGVAPYLAELIQQKNAASAVQGMISMPSVWLMMYGVAGFGWIIAIASPKMVRHVIEMFSDNKIFAIEKEQQKLLEEWGSEIQDNHLN